MKNTRKLVTMGLFAAISVVLVFLIHIPFPPLPFLEYDIADIPILLCTFLWGPLNGFLLTVVVSLLQGLTVSSQSGVIGIFMHIVATGAYCVVSGIIYKHKKTKKNALVSIIAGACAMTTVMVAWNLLVTPYFMGMPVKTVVTLLPLIILFNFSKALINGVGTWFVYKPVSKYLKKDKNEKN